MVRPTTGAGLNPVARLAEQILVSFLPPGSITILNYGYRLISAIGGTVFFRSVIVALIPRLTEAHNHDDQEAVRRLTGVGMRIMLAISLPLTAFMAVLSQPGAIAVFHRGSLTRASAALLGVLLAVYSISLVGSAVQRALLAPFMARLDTRTVLRNTIYGVVANLVLLPLLTLPFGLRQPARHPRRRPRLLARPVRQRRPCLVPVAADHRLAPGRAGGLHRPARRRPPC